MIQFLRFNSSLITRDSTFSVIAGRERALYFMKRSLYLVLFAYSTLFLAVAIPFVKTPFIPIYFMGGFATAVFLMRFANAVIKYFSYRDGSIAVTSSGIELRSAGGSEKIPAGEITYLERNYLDNLVIRRNSGKTSFPLALIGESDRAALLSLFEDMAPRRSAAYKKIWDFVDAIVVALVLAVHIIQYIIQAYFIPTGSMEDTLQIGDHLFVEKITYGPIVPQMLGMKKPVHLSALGIRKIHRRDIVIFRPPHDEDKDYIKRCIAIPGDKFEIKNGKVYINDEAQEEPYVKGVTKAFNFGPSKLQGIVPPGKIIVLGDNRENSQDSRFFGFLDIERIKGKAFILYWNTRQIFKLDFSRFGLIR